MRTIRFIDFWKTSSSVQAGFFKPLLENVYGEPIKVITDSATQVDLEVYSVFPPKGRIVRKALNHFDVLKPPKKDWFQIIPKPNSSRQIWFTGENIRPPLHLDFDAYLSYDDELVDERNIYMPLWVLNIDWFDKKGVHGFAGFTPTQSELLAKRSVEQDDLMKKKFCVSFIGNPENTRLGAIRMLGATEPVDLFGRINGILVENKVEVGKNYKFVLAFENVNTPGYVTEKLLEAQLTGAIPIYWGADTNRFFNESAYINFTEFDNFKDLAMYVEGVGSDKNLMTKMLSEPVMNKPFPIQELISKLRKLIYI